MGSIVFIVLPIAILVGTGLIVAVFFEAAWAGPSRRAAAARGQHLPLLSGGELSRWASQEAARIVKRFAACSLDATASVALARDVEQFTTKVMDESLAKRPGVNDDRCDERNTDVVGVTAPEALAIVDQLRRTLPQSSLAKLRSDALAIAERLAAGNQRCLCSELPTCSLLADNGCCMSFESRPIQCRGRCSKLAEQDDAGPVDAPAFAANVRQGISAGLSRELQAINLDGNVYELNSAVGRALGIPDAAARWARGEAVFEGCCQIAS